MPFIGQANQIHFGGSDPLALRTIEIHQFGLVAVLAEVGHGLAVGRKIKGRVVKVLANDLSFLLANLQQFQRGFVIGFGYKTNTITVDAENKLRNFVGNDFCLFSKAKG